jgi:hypothetical protein
LQNSIDQLNIYGDFAILSTAKTKIALSRFKGLRALRTLKIDTGLVHREIKHISFWGRRVLQLACSRGAPVFADVHRVQARHARDFVRERLKQIVGGVELLRVAEQGCSAPQDYSGAGGFCRSLYALAPLFPPALGSHLQTVERHERRGEEVQEVGAEVHHL